LVPPGSSLLGRPQTEGLLGPLDEAQFTYEWRHPDPRMDELQAAGAALVEQAEAAGEDPRLTFYRLKSLAASVARGRGAVFGPPAGPVAGDGADGATAAAVPRLSEPWFC